MDSPMSSVISASSVPSTVSDLESVVEVNPRKGTPESHVLKTQNISVPAAPIIPDCGGRPLFDTGDGDIELWVNGACFETHKYLIKRFAGLRTLLLDQPPSKALRVHTDGCDTEDFRRMFKVLYASVLEGPFGFDTITLVSALRIAKEYDYPTLCGYAIKHLEDAQLTAIERIKIAREFGLESWEEPAYLELCERDDAITMQEASVLGLDAFVHIAGIREREQRRRGKEVDVQPTTTPSLSFGTNTTQPQTNAFGKNSTGFGMQNQAQPSTRVVSTSGFGSGNMGGAFGSMSGTAEGLDTAAKPASNTFGSTTTEAPATGQGTASPKYAATQERDSTPWGGTTTLHYQSITAMPAYHNFSFEELRAQDYAAGRKNPISTGFGQPPVFGATNATTLATGGLFGQPQQNQPQQQASIFGRPVQPATQSTGLFGRDTQTTSAFERPANNTGTGLVGQQQIFETKPSFVDARLGHAYTRQEWTGSAGSRVKIADCSCRFLTGAGGTHSENSCTITPCSAKVFKALQTQQIAHARSIATLESTVKELTAVPPSVTKSTQDSTASSTMQADVRLMLDALRDPRAGA